MSLWWLVRWALIAAPFAIVYYGLRACLRILWRNPDADTFARLERMHRQAQRPRQERL